MRPILALGLTAGLALATPGWAAPPKGKPVTAGPKTPKAHAVSAPSTPKTHPATAGPKNGPKAGNPGKGHAPTNANATHVPGSNVPRNPKLAARLQGMLPGGMTLEQAALGFKNQGQFIAALNVAKSHDISFTDLKANMVDGGLSLGQSIHKLKPSLDGDVEAARATEFAEQQLEPR
jgi:hypothetical protein